MSMRNFAPLISPVSIFTSPQPGKLHKSRASRIRMLLIVQSKFMKISKVEALAISIPLKAAVSDAVRRIDHRDHLIVRITTEDGLTGEGFTLGYDGSKAMVSMVEVIFRPILEGANAFESEYLWAEMY